jgi:hypothetical protein
VSQAIEKQAKVTLDTLGYPKIFRLNNSTIKPMEMAKSKLNVLRARVGWE